MLYQPYHFNVTLNTHEARRDTAREALTEQLLAEVTAWTPRDRAGAFKRWHQGSLSLIHLSVLSTLEAKGAQSMGVLADELDVSVASATGIVDRMEKHGLVVRKHSASDRRVVLVEPTQPGLEAALLVGDDRRARFAHLLQSLTDDQLAALLDALRTMRTAAAMADAGEAIETSAAAVR